MTIAEEVKEIREMVTVVRDSQLRAEGTWEAYIKRVDDHHKTLFGNGRQGMKSRVDFMWKIFVCIGVCFGGGGGLVALIAGLVYMIQST